MGGGAASPNGPPAPFCVECMFARGLPPCVTFCPVAVSSRALDNHPVFPSHAASGRCVLTAAAACVLCGVISAVAEPGRWRSGGCAACCGVVLRFWPPTPLHIQVVHHIRTSLCFRVREAQQLYPSGCCPGRPPPAPPPPHLLARRRVCDPLQLQTCTGVSVSCRRASPATS